MTPPYKTKVRRSRDGSGILSISPSDADARVHRRVKNATRGNTEETIQRHVVAALRTAGVLFFHVPNASKSTPQYRAKLAALGLSAGVPDLIILDPPPKLLHKHGAALELKTEKGRASTEQAAWLLALRERGWDAQFAYGLDEAIGWLREWGYVR
jgi:hypothetical protein